MKKILVVEDDDAIRRVMKMLLEHEGYEVIGAADGEKGIEALRTEKNIDVAIVDLVMPVMDGFRFIKYTEEHNYRTQILVVTAALNLVPQIPPNVMHMNKPFSIEAFINNVRELAGARD